VKVNLLCVYAGRRKPKYTFKEIAFSPLLAAKIFCIFIVIGDKTMRGEGDKIFGESEKTVIFIHTINQFVIDKSIMAEANYIKLAKEEWQGKDEFIYYYFGEMREAAKSDKKYIVMEYEPAIAEMIDMMMKIPGHYNFCNWKFLLFLHADTCPQGEEPNPIYNTSDEKIDMAWRLMGFPFILSYTLPVGYNLTIEDLENINHDLSGPQTPEEMEELLQIIKSGKKPKKQFFPFYEVDPDKLKEYIDRQRN
jgi:hypothetical protein